MKIFRIIKTFYGISVFTGDNFFYFKITRSLFFYEFRFYSTHNELCQHLFTIKLFEINILKIINSKVSKSGLLVK